MMWGALKLLNAFLGSWLVSLAIGIVSMLWFVAITLAGLILDRPLAGEWRLWLLLATGLWCVVGAVLECDRGVAEREQAGSA